MFNHQLKYKNFTWLRVLLITLLVLGIFFRLVNLDRKVYWYDEGFTSLRVGGYTIPEVVQSFNGQVIGVADGVGGWADVGVNAGIFARELMSNSVRAIQEEPRDSINPLRVLERAHSSTTAKGSSTACIVALNDKV